MALHRHLRDYEVRLTHHAESSLEVVDYFRLQEHVEHKSQERCSTLETEDQRHLCVPLSAKIPRQM
jgi:cystathionine beta-lyase/cystathionine gamma-synthase